MGSSPHSELVARAWSRIDTTKTEDMVPASELRKWLVEYLDLVEQYEDMRCQWEIQAQAATGYFDELAGLKEQLEARERERDEETQAFLTRTTELKEQLEAAVPQWLYDSKVDELRSVEEQLEAAQAIIARAESLIRYLRPDLTATRSRADELVSRIDKFWANSRAPEPDCYEGNIAANVAGERYPANVQGAPSPANGDAETSGTSGRPAPSPASVPKESA